MDWLKDFDINSAKEQLRLYHLLIIDDYSSNITYEFESYAKEHKIILFCLPSHSIHLTQPLDVGCFQPFKHYHTKAIEQIVQLEDIEFGKQQIFVEFQIIREKTLTKAII